LGASALGITVGVGLYKEAFFATILFIVAVNMLPTFIKNIGSKRLKERNVAVKLVLKPKSKMTDLLKTIEGSQCDNHSFVSFIVKELKIKDTEENNQQISLVLSTTEKEYTTEIYYFFKKMEDVVRVEIERL